MSATRKKKTAIKKMMKLTGPYLEIEPAIDVFVSEKVKKVLALGCGSGRHLSVLIDNGFDVYGCDSSESSTRIAKNLAADAKLRHCPITSLRFKDAFFDGIISYDSLQNNRMSRIAKSAEEIVRVTKTGGILFLRVPSSESPETELGKEVEAGTRKDVSLFYGETPRHYFTKEEIESLFETFRILSLRHEFHPVTQRGGKVGASWVLIGKKKRKRAAKKTSAARKKK